MRWYIQSNKKDEIVKLIYDIDFTYRLSEFPEVIIIDNDIDNTIYKGYKVQLVKDSCIPEMDLYLYKNVKSLKLNYNLRGKHLVIQGNYIKQILENKKNRVALLIPTTSKQRQYKKPKHLDFFQIVLFSLNKTCTYPLTIFLGYDEGDKYYDNEENIRKIYEYFNKKKSNYFTLHLHKCYETNNSVTKVWNTLFKRAYDEGYDYFFQLGDDIRLLTPGWCEAFMNHLQINDGIIGPLDLNNQRILTQTFVSRRHMQIFGYYIPPEIKNWYLDDWLTFVYSKLNLCYKNNQYFANNEGGKPRYEVDLNPLKDILKNKVNEGIFRIMLWFKLNSI